MSIEINKKLNLEIRVIGFRTIEYRLYDTNKSKQRERNADLHGSNATQTQMSYQKMALLTNLCIVRVH